MTCLCPGFTRTNFGAVARMKEGDETPFPVMTADAVAKAGLEALRKRKSLVVTHPLDRLWIASGKLVPRWVPAKIGARFFRKAKLDGDRRFWGRVPHSCLRRASRLAAGAVEVVPDRVLL